MGKPTRERKLNKKNHKGSFLKSPTEYSETNAFEIYKEQLMFRILNEKQIFKLINDLKSNNIFLEFELHAKNYLEKLNKYSQKHIVSQINPISTNIYQILNTNFI